MPVYSGGGGTGHETHLCLYFLLSCLICVTKECNFEEDYTAACTVTVNGVPMDTSVIISHCHEPIDVSFLVKVEDPSIEWKYTFVTTNRFEEKDIPGFDDHLVTLRVVLMNDDDRVSVDASYRVDGQYNQSFLHTTVKISTFQDCTDNELGKGDRIAVGTVASLLVLTVAGLSALCWYRRRRRALDHMVLIDNMEAGMPGSTPYMEGAAGKEVQSRRLRVEFKAVAKPGLNTVIENNFVNEASSSKLSSGTLLANGSLES